jgi:hypothetical protein
LNNPIEQNLSHKFQSLSLENGQTLIKPKSQSQLATMDVIPKLKSPTHIGSIAKLTIVRMLKSKQDE